MTWKFTGDKPVYQQIVELIRGAVLSGEFPPGSKIPSVRDLAMLARVNPNTMQRALFELEREGLLISSGTTGRCVTNDQAILSAMRDRALLALVHECAEKFAVFGITPDQAAELLRNMSKEGSNWTNLF